MKSSLKDIIKIESNSDLLNEKFSYKGIYYWALIRPDMLTSYIEDFNNIKVVKDSFRGLTLKKLIKYFVISFFRNYIFIKKKYDYVFWGSDITNILVENGGKFFNRVHDYFAEVEKTNSLVVEESHNFEYKKPRTFKNVCHPGITMMRARFCSKITKKKQERQKIEDYILFLKENFTYQLSDEVWRHLQFKLYTRVKEIDFLIRDYKKFIKRVKPKLIFINGASYGSYTAILTYVAHSLNVKVAELQHGAVSSSHHGYNFDSRLSSKYLIFLPNFFLSYGNFWNEQINLPTKKIAIGNPHLIEEYKRNSSQLKRNLLLYISSGLQPQKDIDFALELLPLLKENDYEILFRPHPLERPFSDELYKDLIKKGIELDVKSLYVTLSQTKFVIGEVSTVLYEAILYDNKVIIIDSTMSKENSIFKNRAANPSEVIKIIQNHKYSDCNVNYFWETTWRENYRNFIEGYL